VLDHLGRKAESAVGIGGWRHANRYLDQPTPETG
jgi:hypothetical protein